MRRQARAAAYGGANGPATRYGQPGCAGASVCEIRTAAGRLTLVWAMMILKRNIKKGRPGWCGLSISIRYRRLDRQRILGFANNGSKCLWLVHG